MKPLNGTLMHVLAHDVIPVWYICAVSLGPYERQKLSRRPCNFVDADTIR